MTMTKLYITPVDPSKASVDFHIKPECYGWELVGADPTRLTNHETRALGAFIKTLGGRRSDEISLDYLPRIITSDDGTEFKLTVEG